MKKIVISAQSLSLREVLLNATKSFFLVGFFMLSFGVIASAQNYVTPEEAMVLLKQKIDESSSSKEVTSTSKGLSNDDKAAAFYQLMAINLQKTNSVSEALEETFIKPNHQGQRRTVAQLAESKIKTLLTR